MTYFTSSPLLFIIFNRPDITQKVFEEIKLTKPSKLYVAADGPRPDRTLDVEQCAKARAIIKDVNWPCEVKILFQEKNLGCKYAVASAISWFFENEEEGIILEDDCLPSNDFFRFCDEMLNKYRYDSRIRHITGCNLQYGKKWGEASYYFSNNTHVWGWASWKRVWNDYDVELNGYEENEVNEQFAKIFTHPLLVQSWKDIFSQLKAKQIDTWDYQLGILNFFNNGLTIIPNSNLISNIGFRSDGTHTFSPDDPNANLVLEKLPTPLTHPKYILSEKQADSFTWNKDFQVEEREKAAIKKQKKLKNRLKKIIGFTKAL